MSRIDKIRTHFLAKSDIFRTNAGGTSLDLAGLALLVLKFDLVAGLKIIVK